MERIKETWDRFVTWIRLPLIADDPYTEGDYRSSELNLVLALMDQIDAIDRALEAETELLNRATARVHRLCDLREKQQAQLNRLLGIQPAEVIIDADAVDSGLK